MTARWYSSTLPIAERRAYDLWARNADTTARAHDERQRDRDLAANTARRSRGRNYVAEPTHMNVSAFWADLLSSLDAHGLTALLAEQLAKPALGHPMFAAARLRSRLRSLESEAAVVRTEIAA